jgi:cysteine sulfinate desulfinase/cysteine desulfurase-like protein
MSFTSKRLRHLPVELSIRFSLGAETTAAEISDTLDAIQRCVATLRAAQ